MTTFGVGFALVVYGASRTQARWILGPLSVAPMAYLGRISYGLYAFHMPMLNHWYREFYFNLLAPRAWGAFVMTVILAALSWHYFEGPINRLKDRFNPPDSA